MPQRRSSTSNTNLTLFDDFGYGTKVPFIYQGQFKWEDPKTLIGGIKGDQALVIKMPKNPIVIPSVVRNIEDFKSFAEEHKISLVKINIEELIEEMEIRGRVLAGVSQSKYNAPSWVKRSVMEGYSPKLIALMTFTLFIFGNTEFASLFIFCISKYSDKTIRKVMKSIWDKTFE